MRPSLTLIAFFMGWGGTLLVDDSGETTRFPQAGTANETPDKQPHRHPEPCEGSTGKDECPVSAWILRCAQDDGGVGWQRDRGSSTRIQACPGVRHPLS